MLACSGNMVRDGVSACSIYLGVHDILLQDIAGSYTVPQNLCCCALNREVDKIVQRPNNMLLFHQRTSASVYNPLCDTD